MNRRRFLGTLAAGSAALGGCTGAESAEDVRDTDGDGVVDEEDYAPTDPSVQRKSDLVNSATPTPTRTEGTAEDGPTPTTAATPTTTPADAIVVDDEYWAEQSHIASYGGDEVRAVVRPDHLGVDYDRMRVALVVAEYPRVRTLSTVYSDAFEGEGPHDVVVPLDLGGAPEGTRLNVIASVVPAGSTLVGSDAADVRTFMETDPFEKRPDGTVARAPHPELLADERGDGYERNAVEGAYSLTVEGRTAGRGWTVQFFGFKSAYLAYKQGARGRSRPEYVSFELTEGSAPPLAGILDEEAEANGFSGKAEKVEFVIDFVQRLPYVPDDVSRGFDDYTKFIMETMVELGGDCEDTAIMLAAVLQADPFNYDMVLIQPPGHMAAGIWSEDPTGYYYTYQGRDYEYIETTGEGWGIGDCPDQYQGVEAYIYQV